VEKMMVAGKEKLSVRAKKKNSIKRNPWKN